jgi:hypothetical protein
MSAEPTTRPERAHRRQLKVVPVPSDATDLERLLAAAERIEDGLSEIHELLESVIDIDETGARFIGVRNV